MKKESIVLNNLVFNNEYKEKKNQLSMLKSAVDFGITNVEIRREYFFDIYAEMNDIKNLAQKNNVKLFYSVPEELFIDNKLNPDLETYFSEAETMGISAIKFNIGEFNEISADELQVLNSFTQRLDQVNIENNQIKTMGSINTIKRFMDIMTENNISIGYVYDMGNWRYVDENELTAALVLSEYVKYIHVKDGIGIGKSAQTVPLGKGEIEWQDILNVLPKDVPIALEYPTASPDEIVDGINMLQTGV